MDPGNPLSAVIFDLYDTLVPGGGRSVRDTVSHEMALDVGVDPQAFADAMRSSFDARARGLLGDVEATVRALAIGLGAQPDSAAVHRAAERRFDLHRLLLRPAPVVLAELDRLRAEGFRIGLISDCSAETPALWPGTALAGRFDAVVFSCSMRTRKPDPALYRMAAAELGVEPERCAYVGDGASGELGGAAAVGMTAIQLRLPGLDEQERAERASVYGAVPWPGPAIDDVGHVHQILAAIRHGLSEESKDHATVTRRPVSAIVTGTYDHFTDPALGNHGSAQRP